MHLNDLREKDPKELTKMAEKMKVENPSSLKKTRTYFWSSQSIRSAGQRDFWLWSSGDFTGWIRLFAITWLQLSAWS